MEPEEGFYEHMNRREETIPVPEMTECMGDDGLQLCRCQTVKNTLGQHEDRPENTKNTGFHESGRGSYLNRYREWQRRPSAHGSPDTPPADPPRTGDAEKSTRPQAP